MAQRYTENLKNASKRFIFCYICNNTTFYYRSNMYYRIKIQNPDYNMESGSSYEIRTIKWNIKLLI